MNNLTQSGRGIKKKQWCGITGKLCYKKNCIGCKFNTKLVIDDFNLRKDKNL